MNHSKSSFMIPFWLFYYSTEHNTQRYILSPLIINRTSSPHHLIIIIKTEIKKAFLSLFSPYFLHTYIWGYSTLLHRAFLSRIPIQKRSFYLCCCMGWNLNRKSMLGRECPFSVRFTEKTQYHPQGEMSLNTA